MARFPRVIPDFMIQALPQGTGTGGPAHLLDYFMPTRSSASRWRCNSGPNTQGSQFLHRHKQAADWLDGKHTVFGGARGYGELDSLENRDRPGDRPVEPQLTERRALD